MKKNIIKLIMGIFAFSLIFMVACDDNEINYPVDHAYITTSFGNTANTIQVNGTMSFIDLSRGVKSRTWTFPENTVDTGYNAIASSIQPVVKVRFTTPGQAEVHITQEFTDSVWANGKKQVATFDSVIVVKVLDSVRASFMAERALDLSELTLASMNEVIAGRVVNFTSTSTGEPTTMRWTITRQGGTSVELTGASVSNKFSVPGTYDVTLKASSQFGSSSVTLKDYIKIIPSTDPVTLDEVNRDAEDVIGLVFSRAIQTPTEINKTALTVSITNGGAPVSAQILSVTKVDNIVKIKLNTKIYSSDIIKVSYDDTKGDLITEDAVNVKSFTDVQLMNFKVANLLTGSAFDSGFENSVETDWPYLWWGGIYDKYTLKISTTQKHSGTKSSYIEYLANGGMIIGYKPGGSFANFNVTAGKKYSIGAWIYMVDLGDSDPAKNLPDIRFYWQANTDWSVGGITFSSDFPKGTWVYKTVTVTAPATGTSNSLTIRGYNENNPKALKFYMDDITLTQIEDRP